MASDIGIDGLISGLDTTSLINKLMAAEATQQTFLKNRQTSLSSLVSALQSLNTKVASLATAAKTAADPVSWQAAKATSSSTSATATATSAAQPSSVTFTVDDLAQAQATLYTLPSGYTEPKPSFTVTHADGTTTTVTALSSHPDDIAAALNAKDTGVHAAVVNVGTKDAPDYRLQVTGAETGAEHGFTLSVGNATDPAELVGTDLRTASDARIRLWAGTSSETTVTSSTNTFAGLMSGVDVTVSATGPDPVTVTVTRDADAMSKLASSLVSNLNAILGDIADRTASQTSTDEDGRTLISGGLFSGNTTIRLLQQDLLDAGSVSASGKSAASVGISLSKDGTFSFDSAAFAAAYRDDPSAVEDVVQAMAASLQKVADTASDPAEGSLTTQITSNEDEVDDLGKRIDDWDVRLADRRQTLVNTYAQMEVQLSNLQSQSSWLSTQLAQLTASQS